MKWAASVRRPAGRLGSLRVRPFRFILTLRSTACRRCEWPPPNVTHLVLKHRLGFVRQDRATGSRCRPRSSAPRRRAAARRNSEWRRRSSGTVIHGVLRRGPLEPEPAGASCRPLQVCRHWSCGRPVIEIVAGPGNHINEQRHSYWAHLFARQGLVPFDLFRPFFWGNDDVCFWYRQNTFLYCRSGSVAWDRIRSHGFREMAERMDCVHHSSISKMHRSNVVRASRTI